MTVEGNVRASLYMMLAMTGFVVNDALVKSIDGRLPQSQILVVRGTLLGVLILFLLWRQGLIPRYREALHPMVIARSLGELFGTITFLAALTRLPFATVSAILQALPLAVTLGAALFLGEKVGWRRWLAIVIGFGGVMLIIRPGTLAFEPATLLVVFTVIAAAARDLFTRSLPRSLPSLLVSAMTTTLVVIAGLLWWLGTRDWLPMTPREWGLLGGASVCLFFGYQFIVLAMRTGEVAYVVPYRYTSLLVAILLGLVFFNEVPDRWTLGGAVVIVATGLFTLYRELLGRRNHPAAAAVPAASGIALSAGDRAEQRVTKADSSSPD